MNVMARNIAILTQKHYYLQVKVVAINLAILTQKHFLLAGESGGQKHRYTYTETQLITRKDLLQWRPETLLCLHRNSTYLQVEM